MNVIDFVDARDARRAAAIAAAGTAAGNAEPRKLHPDLDTLPGYLLADILQEYPDLVTGRDRWIAGDAGGHLLYVDVWEVTPGVFDWEATYAHPQLTGGAA